MSRQRRTKENSSPASARFPVGSRVRVRAGTTDPDFPDLPLGGWTGKVRETDQRAGPPAC